MCDPVTLGTGLALLAGGTAATTHARSERREAMDEAAARMYRAEEARQDQYDRERLAAADQVFAETAGVENVEEQMARAVEERTATRQANAPQPADEGYNRSAAFDAADVRNIETRAAENREAADAELTQRFGALARLRSLGDAFQAFELFRQPLVGEINAVNSFARHSGQVAPIEAEAAARQHADDKMLLEMLGTIASGVGSAAIGAGAMGGAAAGAEAATAAGAEAAGGALNAGALVPGMAANLFMTYPGAPNGGYGYGVNYPAY